MRNILPLAICALLFAACSNNKPTQDLSIVPPAKSTAATDTMSALTNAADKNVVINGSNDQQPAPVQLNEPAANAAVTNTTGLNPAHGAPGHRCDIAVGAPLNSAPSISKTTSATAVPAPAMNPASNSTAKLNPPHGQPGHDCAKPVGQPL